MTLCKIQGCDNKVASETNGGRFGKNYCFEHSKNGVKTFCSKCGISLTARAGRYFNTISKNKPILCKKCSAIINGNNAGNKNLQNYNGSKKQKINLSKLNSDPKHIKISINNCSNWNNSEAGKKQIKELGLKYGPTIGANNCSIYAKSEKGRAKSAKNITIYNNSDLGKEHLKNLYNIYNNSEAGKKQIKELGLKYGPTIGANNLLIYVRSEKGRKISAENITIYINSDAGKKHLIKIIEYTKSKKGRANSSKIMTNYINSDKGKQHIIDHNIIWNNSDKGKEHIKNLGLKYGPIIGAKNLIIWKNSNAGKQQVKNLGLKYGPITGTKNCLNYINSEAGKLHIKDLLKFRKQKIKEAFTKIFEEIGLKITLNTDNATLDASNYDSFSILDNIPGVWCVNSKDICLDVAQTQDIGNEMRLAYRKLISKIEPKYIKISNFIDLKFIVIIKNIKLKKDRETIEELYAIQENALLWNAAPMQLPPTVEQIDNLRRLITI